MTLALEDATCRAGKAVLLDRISLTVPPGALTVIMGPNGAGKSTALGVLAGDIKPDKGRALLDGRPLSSYGSAALARRRAVLTQSQSIEFPITAYEIVALGLLQGRWSEQERQRALADSFAVADVAHLAERGYPSLSGGERQRVQFARALAQIWRPAGHGMPEEEARYLLLDEPTASLDLKHQVMTLDHCRKLAADGVGVLCILHDPALARRYADSAVLMVGGRVLESGPAAVVLRPDAIARAFDIDERHSRAALGILAPPVRIS